MDVCQNICLGLIGGSASVWISGGCPQDLGQSVGVKDAQHLLSRSC